MVISMNLLIVWLLKSLIYTASDEEEEGAVGGKAIQKKEKEVGNEKDEGNDRKEDESAGWFSSWGIPSGITKVVENTTKAVENTVCTSSPFL